MSKQYSLTKEFACSLFGKTRQGYNKVQALSRRRFLKEKALCKAVEEIREIDPGIGGYKLWIMLKDIFGEDMVRGRDSFYKFLDKYHFTLPCPKPRRTTNSNHRFHKYKNLIKDKEVTAPDQLWVSDITYIDLESDCCYLHLVTDVYSHKIVGWCLSSSMMAIFTTRALCMAIEQSGKNDLTGLIHHSDRGSQYCCDAYVQVLHSHNIQISMTEDYKPTDNAIAERANGIIKTEYLYRIPRFKEVESARKGIGEFIKFYNEDRPHMSIDFHTPSEVYNNGGHFKKCWRNDRYMKKSTTFA